jgi:dienelactone hydrolase
MSDEARPATSPPIRPPPLLQTIAECLAFVRRERLTEGAISEIAALAPRGAGGAVMVIPSLFRNDAQTRNVRALLSALDYHPFGWEQGANFGPTPALMAGARKQLLSIAERHGPVAIIGFSMGGLFARWLAHSAAPQVRQVITVGSPIRNPLQSAFIPAPVLEVMWRGQDLAALANTVGRPLPVPSLSLYSRRDGIVAWGSCCTLGRHHENVEVACHHVLMPQNPQVFGLIASHLAEFSKAAPANKRVSLPPTPRCTNSH